MPRLLVEYKPIEYFGSKMRRFDLRWLPMCSYETWILSRRPARGGMQKVTCPLLVQVRDFVGR
jgi:hypothetical protein